jgi:hypothetical protein
MSTETIHSINLLCRERLCLKGMCDSLVELDKVHCEQRDLAIKEHAQERRDVLLCESRLDNLAEAIEKIATSAALGAHGSPLEQLDRIGVELVRLDGELGDIKPQPDEGQVFPPAPTGFGAPEWADAFLGTMLRLGYPTKLDRDWVVAWFANALMRGYDEHARKYSELLDACILGARDANVSVANGLRLYTLDAELAIIRAADKHIDPEAKP